MGKLIIGPLPTADRLRRTRRVAVRWEVAALALRGLCGGFMVGMAMLVIILASATTWPAPPGP